MSDYIIKVENLGKKYSIQHQGERESYVALRDVVAGRVKGVGSAVLSGLRSWVPGLGSSSGNGFHPTNGTISQPPKPLTEDFWALKDVSFEVKQGEVLGIIGRNGAGKSTLLKILSRITEPTEGRVRIRGRVASLLEVGTGFHPELTGRENIFVNGAILGMARAEISKKFDEIVAFAEVEQFLDTPVKRYSSGMYVRLAFAVAAHLEPEILIVDEVLAVGDANFQKKCLGKIENVSRHGRTVLFVSHNMAAVSNLCGLCILLSSGEVTFIGPPREVIDMYLSHDGGPGCIDSDGSVDLSKRENVYTPSQLIIRRVRLQNERGQARSNFQMGQAAEIIIGVHGFSQYRDSLIGVTFKSSDGQSLASINTGMVIPRISGTRQVDELISLRVPRLPFTPGRYSIAIAVACGPLGLQQRVDYVDRAAEFAIDDADVYSTGYRVTAAYGMFYLDANWEIGTE